MFKQMFTCAAAAAVLVGCATSGEPAPSPTPSVAAGNGSLYVASQGKATITIERHPIGADGGLGPGLEVVSGTTGFTSGPYVIDGIGNTVAVGEFEDYWTTSIGLRDATTGKQFASVEAPGWCGGEGLTYNPCALASEQRLVRTSERGDPEQTEATVWVSSLTDGSDTGAWGPFPNLGVVYGTTDPSVVLITVSDTAAGDPPASTPGKVVSLDPATGATKTIGSYGADWLPICPLGSDALLGWTPNGSTARASVVGGATIGKVGIPEQHRPLGCSADGRFLYLESGGGEEAAVITRVALADGSSAAALTLDAGASATTVTR